MDLTLDGQVPSITTLEDTGVPMNSIKVETEAEAFKRMIQERNRDEEELEEAVPFSASGVSSVINSRANSRAASRATSRANSVVTSGATTPRRDLFSGVTSMKEMFDISYAVHRMTEEKQRRKSLRSIHDPDAHRRSLFMNEINGDTSSEEDISLDETSLSSQTDEDSLSAAIRLEKKKQEHKKHGTKSNKGGLFELKMENATLLGRRKVPSATQPIDDVVEDRKVPSATQPINNTTRKVPSATQPIEDSEVPAQQPFSNHHYYHHRMIPSTNTVNHTTFSRDSTVEKSSTTETQKQVPSLNPLMEKAEIKKLTQPVDPTRRKIPSATQPIDD